MTQLTELPGHEIQAEERKLMESETAKLEKIANRITEEIFSIKRKIHIIGKLLYQAREMLPHGQFTKWLEDRFKGDLPYSTAWLYASIYNRLDYYPELIEQYPLHILMDVRKLPIEILKLIKEKPDQFKEKRKEVMDLYRSYKRGEVDVPDFFEQSKEILNFEVLPDEEAEPRVKRGKEIYKKHLFERLKNQFGALLKTIDDLDKALNEDEVDEVRDSLSEEIDLTIMGMARIKELLAENERLVCALSQYRNLPSSPERTLVKRSFTLNLPASKL